MGKQTHRTCIRMSVEEYSRLMERSKAAGLPANAWLMEQLTDNRPIISRDGVMPDFLRLLNQRGREINTVARAFNSGYGTAEGLRQVLRCLKDIAQAAYEIRKEMTEEQFLRLERYRELTRLPVTTYFRKLIAESEIMERPSRIRFRLYEEVNKIDSNIRQILRNPRAKELDREAADRIRFLLEHILEQAYHINAHHDLSHKDGQ